MKGSVPPTWSGAFTYVSTTSSITWRWTGLDDLARRRHQRRPSRTARSPSPALTSATTYYFYPYWDDAALRARIGSQAAQALPRMRRAQRQISRRSSNRCKGAFRCRKARWSRPPRQRHRRRLRRRQRKLPARGHVGDHERARHRRHRDVRSGRTSALPGAAPGGEAGRASCDLQVRDADTFIRLHFSNAESLDVTPHHIFTLADGSPMRAERLCLRDIFVGRFGRHAEAHRSDRRNRAESLRELRADAPILRRPPRAPRSSRTTTHSRHDRPPLLPDHARRLAAPLGALREFALAGAARNGRRRGRVHADPRAHRSG